MMTQLSVVLADNGVSGAAASAMISLFAAGMLAGRFFSGLALDRFAAPLVAMTGGLLSAVGLFIFASDLNGREVLMLAALLIGLTAGAEGDVVAYLVARNFGLRIYSSIAGIIASTVAIGSLVCAISLSAMLSAFGNFTIFMLVAGIAVTIGSVVFLLLPFHPVVKDEESEAELENTAQDTSGGAAAVAKSPA
jgi:MFS family permease